MTTLYIFQNPFLQVDLEECFRDPQMRGRADRQKLGQPLDGAEQDREKIVVHAARGIASGSAGG